MSGERFTGSDLRDAEFREVDLTGARFIGSVLVNVEIDSLVENLTVNGVDVVPLVEAELDRRHPERLALRPTDAAGARAAIDVVEEIWAPTLALARGLPANTLHERVAGEWSFVETLRHLVFVHDAWFAESVLREPAPWHPLGLTPAYLEPADYGIDPEARPELDEVLALREERMMRLRQHLAGRDDADLQRELPADDTGGIPPPEPRTTLDCLRVILDEEWAHHRFAVRDLAVLAG